MNIIGKIWGKHWRGESALPWALGINLVLLRILILWSDQYTLPPYIPARAEALAATIVFCILCHGVIYPWQVVGVLRAIKRRNGGVNFNVWVWAAYLSLMASLVFTLLGLFSAYQSLLPERFIVEDPLALEKARANQYTLRLGPDGRRIYVSGTFALGLTEKLSALLAQNPGVTDIVLQSDGGQVYEGRGVAHLIKNRGLNTFVTGVCKSACATAFIGGRQRNLGPRGKLGFHQYGLELNFPTALYDLKGEQDKEIKFYRGQGITGPFLDRVFSSAHKDIWFPNQNGLLKAGVVHKIIPAMSN